MNYRTVKITEEGYEALQELHAAIIRDGWTSIGSERKDVPTMSAVLDEAVVTLYAKVPPAKGKGKR